MSTTARSSLDSKPAPYAWGMGDVLVALLITAFGVYFLWTQLGGDRSATKAVVSMGGVMVTSFYLDKDSRIDLNEFGADMVLQVKNGRVRVASSDCAQQLCVRHGWIDRPKEALLCLPNHVTVELVGEDAEYDAISR